MKWFPFLHSNTETFSGTLSLDERALGAYLALAAGDALGATVEFMTAGEIKGIYGVHDSLCGGGWLYLKPGQVTDDTQMCLAVGNAMTAAHDSGGWDLEGVADEFVRWLRSLPQDVGNTCRRGIRRYMQEGLLRGVERAEEAGNGALMRNLPVALGTALPSLDDLVAGRDAEFERRSIEQSRITHGNVLSDAAVLLVGRLTRILLAGGGRRLCREVTDRFIAENPKFAFEPWPGKTSGYVVDTVQTVLDGFFNSESLEECVVKVVNRGGDADTTGAVVGQLAGALWGVNAIPARWLDKLDPKVRKLVTAQTEALLRLGGR
jgi:ADP-ribosyl-[dinitrogen reductase] hydrolase